MGGVVGKVVAGVVARVVAGVVTDGPGRSSVPAATAVYAPAPRTMTAAVAATTIFCFISMPSSVLRWNPPNPREPGWPHCRPGELNAA